MFRWVFIIAMAATVLTVGVHHQLCGRPRRLVGDTRRGGWLAAVWGALIYAATLLAFLAAAVTAYYPALRTDGGVTGWWMLVHTCAGAAFAVCLVLLTATRAERLRLDRPGEPIALRLSFWAMVLFGLLTIGSIMASMLEAVPAADQACLYEIHRYCSVALVVATVLNVYFNVAARRPGSEP